MDKKLITLLLLLACLRGRCQSTDTCSLYFPLNDAKISKEIENSIDRLLFKDVLIHGQKLMVLGYADYVGDTNTNNKLSTLRAKNVKDYLVQSGFTNHDITLCIGKGKIDRIPINGQEGYAQDRKVQIIILHELKSSPAVKTALPLIAPPPPIVAPQSLEQLKVNETITLDNVQFINSKSVMLAESYPVLDKLVRFLKT